MTNTEYVSRINRVSDPKEHPDHLHTVAICVPVRPL